VLPAGAFASWTSIQTRWTQAPCLLVAN